jgi:hypothetical protein
MVSVMNACVRSWECGKSSAFSTFPQPLLLFFECEFLEKFTMGGEGGANASYLPAEALFKRLIRNFLTLQNVTTERNYE